MIFVFNFVIVKYNIVVLSFQSHFAITLKIVISGRFAGRRLILRHITLVLATTTRRECRHLSFATLLNTSIFQIVSDSRWFTARQRQRQGFLLPKRTKVLTSIFMRIKAGAS